MNLESYARIDENAKIQGVALIPRISRNNNLYTKEELRRFDGVTVPLNWEHDGNKVIGEATFHYNSELETVYYEGVITDPSAAMLAKNKLLFTSIEATPTDVKHICNGNRDCFQMPFGLVPEGLALTETPGVPETSVEVLKESLENTLKQIREHTDADHEFIDKYGATEIIHKTIKPRAEGLDNPADKSVDTILKDTLAGQAEQIESQLKAKQQALELFTKVMDNNEDPLLHDYVALLQQDVEFLSNQLISLRKDGEYVAVESLDKIVANMKERYLCDCCGDVKKKANIEAKEQPKDNDIKQWITVNGVHIPIKKGQNKDDVVDDFISKQKDEPKKDTPKTDKPKRNYKVGVVNDKKKLDVADKVLSDLPDDFVKDFDITFNDSPQTHQQGSWQYNKVEININNIPDEDIASVITHELGHANFDQNKEWDIISVASTAMTNKPISSYSAKFQNDVISTQQDFKDAKQKYKNLPTDASDDDKRVYRVRMENAGIDYNLALKQYAHEFYADLQSWKLGHPPKTKTDISKEEIDDIIKKTDDALKNPNNKQMYDTMFPFLTKESLCPNCGEPKEAVDLVGPHPTAQIKKKKRHFEFKEASNDDWKEYEHYLYEDATKSGQKSDTVGNPEFRSFTHSSSFVGNVLWDRESLEMDIILNGKKYHFCNVSERLFDAFEGADSKGAFFNREIKSLHDC